LELASLNGLEAQPSRKATTTFQVHATKHSGLVAPRDLISFFFLSPAYDFV